MIKAGDGIAELVLLTFVLIFTVGPWLVARLLGNKHETRDYIREENTKIGLGVVVVLLITIHTIIKCSSY